MQTDSTTIQLNDTAVKSDQILPVQPENTQQITQPVRNIAPAIQPRPTNNTAPKTVEAVVVIDSISNDSIVLGKDQVEYLPFKLFSNINSDSSIYTPVSNSSVIIPETNTHLEIKVQERNLEKEVEKNWVFGIAVLLTLVLLIVRIYFQKHLTHIISAAVNLQIADKLLREKNVLVRRVFMLLNINFVITLSLYIYIVFKRMSINFYGFNGIQLFLTISVIILILVFIRLFLLYFIGKLFNSFSLFREYIHNSYLLNKNLGLYLLPLALSVFYMPDNLSSIGFYLATFLVILTLLYRYLRSIQIILKHKVLYFYSILYLCSLEILPALVGIKFVLSLR